MYLAGNFPVK